jgi:hypothetical protein
MFTNDFSPIILADTIRLHADGTGSRNRVIMLNGSTALGVGDGVRRPRALI